MTLIASEAGLSPPPPPPPPPPPLSPPPHLEMARTAATPMAATAITITAKRPPRMLPTVSGRDTPFCQVRGLASPAWTPTRSPPSTARSSGTRSPRCTAGRGRAADHRARRGHRRCSTPTAAATSTASRRCGATSTATATRAIDAAVRDQLDRVAHSTLLGLSHPPRDRARRAAGRARAADGLTRVFFSDNGSTAVEVALKMAFQYWQQRGEPRAHGVRLPARRLPRRHARLGVRRRDRPLPRDASARCSSTRCQRRARRRRRRWSALLADARRASRRGRRRAAGPGRGRHARAARRASCARCASCATRTTSC